LRWDDLSARSEERASICLAMFDLAISAPLTRSYLVHARQVVKNPPGTSLLCMLGCRHRPYVLLPRGLMVISSLKTWPILAQSGAFCFFPDIVALD